MKAYGLARIGRDVEIRFTPSGEAVANLSLAFSWGKKGEDGKRSTEWVDASIWGKRAEALAPYLLKGGLVVVTLDDVHIETYQGRNGEGKKLVGRVSDLELAGGGDRQSPTPQRQAPTRTAPTPQRPGAAGSGFEDMDDDIPF